MEKFICLKCDKPAEMGLGVLYWNDELDDYVEQHADFYCHEHDPRAFVPNLLTALKSMLAAAKCGYDPVVALKEYGAQAEAAIAKAEGKVAQAASPRGGQVVVYMAGGVVQQVEAPPHIEVEVRDYDIENYLEHELVEDECGNRYRQIHFDGKEAP